MKNPAVRFLALGTTVEAEVRTEVVQAQQLFAVLRRTVEAFEARFSRFRASSELFALNRQSGTTVHVSDVMFTLLQTAKDAYRHTNGLVDITVGGPLIAVGYASSFERIQNDTKKSAHEDDTVPRATFADVTIDEKEKNISVPRGTVLDFGGIGKGLLLDTLRPVFATVTDDWWVSLGGDMLVSGTDEDGKLLSIGVQDPFKLDHDVATLHPPSGIWGIATSGTTKRHGVHQGRPWHHLIDPHTGLPSTSDIVAATVLAPIALQADVAAKTALLLGAEAGLAWVEQQPHLEAALTTKDNTRCLTAGMHTILHML